MQNHQYGLFISWCPAWMLTLTGSVSVQQGAEELTGDGEPDSDLGQLPGHHPLIKDGMSDEGLPHQYLSFRAVFSGADCKMFYSSEARAKSNILLIKSVKKLDY